MIYGLEGSYRDVGDALQSVKDAEGIKVPRIWKRRCRTVKLDIVSMD